MKNLLTIIACLMVFSACQKNGPADNSGSPAADSTATTAPNTADTKLALPTTMCYLRVEGKDSTTMSITLAADSTVTGSYDWQPLEQDGAHGTLTGKMKGRDLLVTYDYTIEGSNQQEEKLFRLTGELLAEGEGELTEGEGGILKLKDPTKLRWKALSKVACK